MAIIETNLPLRPITGFRRIDATEASYSIPRIGNPSPEMDYGFSRAHSLLNGNSRTLKDIQNGYMTDGYIHQAVSRYAEKVIKEGYYFSGEEAPVKYLQTRLDMMTVATGEFFFTPILEALRDYIKYANGYLLKARYDSSVVLSGPKVKGIRRIQGINGKGPIGGYYSVSPLHVSPKTEYVNGVSTQTGWYIDSCVSGMKTVDKDDLIHITYDKQSGSISGIPWVIPALEDVRALRALEEMVIQLVFKSLNPLIHHEVPDSTGTGRGRQEDVTRTAQKHDVMAVNGYIITPPGHKIQMIGAESKALRAEGYLKMLRYRVYAALGVNPVMMGEASTTGVGVTEGFTAIMHDRVRFFQKEFADALTYGMLWELLEEGGYSPAMNSVDRAYWVFNEVDIDRRIKEESNNLLKYHGNAITEPELRATLKMSPIAESDRKDMYLNLVQIPQITAQASARGSAYQNATQEAATNISIDGLKAFLTPSVTSGVIDSEHLCLQAKGYADAHGFDFMVKDSINDAIVLFCASTSESDSIVEKVSKLHAYLDVYAQTFG